MTANFTSGWLGNGESAWHGEGLVTEGTLPAREAFEKADALFAVEKRNLTYPIFNSSEEVVNQMLIPQLAMVRTDSNGFLGIVSQQYEIVQNESLLRMAEFIREEVDMDSVVVLAGGAKVAFTATIRGAEADIVPGDTVKRRIVGYLGHDGKTSVGAIFTNVRVVCCNTLAMAQAEHNKRTLTHKQGVNHEFNSLIQSINVARETFNKETDLMKDLARHSCTNFREFLEEVYEDQIPEGKQVDDMRKYKHLRFAYASGMGAQFAPHSLWNAVNAVTEVETSTLKGTARKRQSQFAKANFGTGLFRSQKAMQVARELLTV